MLHFILNTRLINQLQTLFHQFLNGLDISLLGLEIWSRGLEFSNLLVTTSLLTLPTPPQPIRSFNNTVDLEYTLKIDVNSVFPRMYFKGKREGEHMVKLVTLHDNSKENCKEHVVYSVVSGDSLSSFLIRLHILDIIDPS